MRFTIALAAGLLAGVVAGCEKKQSTFDLSNPRAAGMTFATALERDDADTARSAAVYGGMEADLVTELARFASSARKLRGAITSKFGDDAGRVIEPKTIADASRRLADADVLVDGDHATLRIKDGSSEVRLKRIDGQWKVDVGALILGNDLHRSIDATRRVTEALNMVRADVESGKLASADQTKLALQQQLIVAMNPRLKPAVSAATSPAMPAAE